MLKSTCKVLSGFSPILITVGSVIWMANPSNALTFTQVNVPIVMDFTGFTGAGFSPNPGAGQLDSDDWEIKGFSDGDLNFGDTRTTPNTDYARGTSSGGVINGGIYGFDVGGGNIALGVQPSIDNFTPGTLTLRLTNGTGITVSGLDISYILYNLNNAERGNTFNFSYSLNNTAYIPISALDYTSPETPDSSPTWVANPRSTMITGLTLAPGSNIYLRWTSNDSLGSNFRDEFALDDLMITARVPYEFEKSLGVLTVGILLMMSRIKKQKQK